MHKLIKRRMHPYSNPLGGVRGYHDERFASAPADGTNYANYSNSNRAPGLDQTHREAAIRIAVDAIRGFATGVAEDMFKKPREAARNGLEQAKNDAVKSVVENCVNCHIRR